MATVDKQSAYVDQGTGIWYESHSNDGQVGCS